MFLTKEKSTTLYFILIVIIIYNETFKSNTGFISKSLHKIEHKI